MIAAAGDNIRGDADGAKKLCGRGKGARPRSDAPCRSLGGALLEPLVAADTARSGGRRGEYEYGV